MNKMKAFIITGVVGLSIGGWALYDSNTGVPKVSENVVNSTAMPDTIDQIDESNRSVALVATYKEMIKGEYLDKKKEVQRSAVEKSLATETKIDAFPFPLTLKGEEEPMMTNVLSKVLSRTDGTTNEMEEKSYQTLNKNAFAELEKLFTYWTNDEINKKTFDMKWANVLEEEKDSLLTTSNSMIIDFPYSPSAVEMFDEVLEKVEENGGSSAPHIAFVYVKFNPEEMLYTLYYAESHIE